MLQWHEKPADRPGSGHTKSPGDAFSAELQPVEETGPSVELYQAEHINPKLC
jgi:hypothetical protein